MSYAPILRQPDDPQPHEAPGVDWLSLGCGIANPYVMRLDVNEGHMGTVIRHVPNTEYVRWMEVAAVSHAASLGFTPEWHKANDVLWFVRKHEIDFLGEIFEGDVILIATWVDQMEKTRSHRRYLAWRLRSQLG